VLTPLFVSRIDSRDLLRSHPLDAAARARLARPHSAPRRPFAVEPYAPTKLAAAGITSQRRIGGGELLSSLGTLTDGLTGIAAGVVWAPPSSAPRDPTWAFRVPLCQPELLAPPALPARARTPISAFATALDPIEAVTSALCEAMERYCFAVAPPDEATIVASFRELGEEALDPERLPSCSAREREKTPPELRLKVARRNAPMRWIRGFSLTRVRPLWVPLSTCTAGLPGPPSEHLMAPITTGFAAGATYDQAVLGGLCEAIERDSTVIWWLHKLPRPRLADPRAIDPRVSELLEPWKHAGVRTELLDLSTDVSVPVLAVVQVQERSPFAVLGTACRPRAEDAAVHAIEEALSRKRWGSSAWNVYAGPHGPSHFAFALEAPATGTLPESVDDADPIRAIVGKLAAVGVEAIVVDVTQPEVREAGLVVVRVLAPELVPKSPVPEILYLATPRLYSVPEKLGYGRRTEDTITQDPIPS
jgi:ribosomal protein S12 methylthiotransferase accessory factor